MVLENLTRQQQQGSKSYAILIDPDMLDRTRCEQLAAHANSCNNVRFFIGGSILESDHSKEIIHILKSVAPQTEVVLFPGNIYQVEPSADAILFLSLISGRNPELLIGNHVLAAPRLRKSKLEVIPTGYMLIDGGRTTSANYMSGTLPIPSDKPQIAACTAMAGEMLGLSTLYMDAGSGALQQIPAALIAAVRSVVEIPIIVGGGIRTKADAALAFEAGADLIVVGTAVEQSKGLDFLGELSSLTEELNSN